MLDPTIQARLDAAAQGREDKIAEGGSSLAILLKILADLRGFAGCPWDAEQSLASLRQYIREEADEVCEALDNILWYEDDLRRVYGVNPADPTPPAESDKARTKTKGLSIAHHPHRNDFDSTASASGAPLPTELTTAQQEHLDSLYAALQDEIGDIMLQGAFLGEILQAMGRPGLEKSLGLIVEKLIRRHPHVYGDRKVSGSAEVLSNWEEIKRAERKP